MSFGERLIQLIKEQGLSQARFADETGITRSRMNNYIKGRSEPGHATLVAMAQRLKVTTDYLLGCDPPPASRAPGLFTGIPEFAPGDDPPPGDDRNWIPLYAALSRVQAAVPPAKPRGWLKTGNINTSDVTFKRPYALLVEDDSMPGELLPGDIVYIQPSFVSHTFLQSTPYREILAVRMSAADEIGLSLKRCHVKDNMLVCVADNPEYELVILDMNRTLFVPIVGAISGVWRSYKGRGLQDGNAKTEMEPFQLVQETK